MYKVYLDNCCYSRLSDDRRIINNYLECEAVKLIFEFAEKQKICIVGSNMLLIEMEASADILRRYRNSILLSLCKEIKQVDVSILERAKEIRSISNIKTEDSIHLACAETMNVDALLTTDYKFIKMASKVSKTRVMNPIDWIREVSKNDSN